MEEEGIVIEDRNGRVVIRAERSSSCDNCASKSLCHSGASGEEGLIEAENPVGARVGDHVVFTVGAGSIMKAGVLLYLVPILCFIAGVVLGQTAGTALLPSANADLVSGVFGVVFLVLAFIGIKLYSKSLAGNKSYSPQVIKVV